MRRFVWLWLWCGLLLATGLPAACQQKPPRPDAPHPRVVTFSPALTDLVFQMGLGDHVVGVTSKCTLPAGQERQAVGDRQSHSAEAILAVEPDLVLVQQNESDFDSLKHMRPQVRVVHFKIETIKDIASAMVQIGELLGKPDVGRACSRKFLGQLEELKNHVAGLGRPKVLFVMGCFGLSSGQMPMTGGRNSFVHEMIEIAGGTDAAEGYARWSNLNMENVLALAPDVLVCWTNPQEEKAALKQWQMLSDLPAVRNGRLYVVSDPGWSTPTASLADLTVQLANMIHPTSTSGRAPP